MKIVIANQFSVDSNLHTAKTTGEPQQTYPHNLCQWDTSASFNNAMDMRRIKTRASRRHDKETVENQNMISYMRMIKSHPQGGKNIRERLEAVCRSTYFDF